MIKDPANSISDNSNFPDNSNLFFELEPQGFYWISIQ